MMSVVVTVDFCVIIDSKNSDIVWKYLKGDPEKLATKLPVLIS